MKSRMIKKIVSIALVLSCVAAITACGKKASVQTNENAVQVGDEVEDFKVALTNGQQFKLSENRDKVVLLNFWATWCNPCVNEMPAIEKIYNEYSADEVQIIGADDGEGREVVQEFVKENDYTYPMCYDIEGTLSALFPSDGIPYTVIIGKDGKVAATFYGAKDADDQYQKLTKALDEALAK